MTTAEIALPSARTADRVSQATAVEQARAVAEVAAAVRVAQENPRDVSRAVDGMRQACRQRALADRAFYSLPRGRDASGRAKTIEGSTVHLARELARCWGNVDHGIRELRRDDAAGESEMQAWAWDQESNVRASRSFIVPHDRMVGKGADKRRERLIDLADIANNNNSVAARAVRETIKQVLPVWFVAEAEEIATRTLQDGGGKTLPQQVADAITHFRDTWNVTTGQLEDRLDRKSPEWTPQDLGLLRVISGELSRGEKRVEFEFPNDQARVTVAEIKAKAAPAPESSGLDEFHPDTTSNPDPPKPATRAQIIAIKAAQNDLGITRREDQIAQVSKVAGRTVESTNELTHTEATAVLKNLAEISEPPAGGAE